MHSPPRKFQPLGWSGWLGTEGNALYMGQFGFFARMAPEELDYQRIIQLGWSTAGIQKSFYVLPEGFVVSSKAIGKHKKSHDLVIQEGKPLGTILRDFMHDVIEIDKQGGRIARTRSNSTLALS